MRAFPRCRASGGGIEQARDLPAVAGYVEGRVACHPGRDRIEDGHDRGRRGLRVEVLPELAAGLAVSEQGLDRRDGLNWQFGQVTRRA